MDESASTSLGMTKREDQLSREKKLVTSASKEGVMVNNAFFLIRGGKIEMDIFLSCTFKFGGKCGIINAVRKKKGKAARPPEEDP